MLLEFKFSFSSFISYLRLNTLFFCLFFFCTFPSTNSAQNQLIKIEKFNVEDGLSDRFVNSIFQDRDGFIWVLTNKGVNRFDGNHFQVFNKLNSNFDSDKFNNAVQDNEGNIWLCKDILERKHQWLYLITRDLKSVSIDEYFGEKMPFSSSSIQSILKTTKGFYLLLTSGKIYNFDSEFKLVATINPVEDLISTHLVSVDKNNNASCIYTDTFIHFNSDGKELSRQALPGTVHKFGINNKGLAYIFCLSWNTDPLQILSKAESEHVFQKLNFPDIEQKLDKYTKSRPSHYRQTVTPYISSKNEVLLFTHKELVNFHHEQQPTTDLNAIIKENFQKYTIKNFFIDKNDKVWIATENGFYLLMIKASPFSKVLNNNISTRGIIEIDSSTVLTGTYSGIMSIDKKKLVVKQKKNLSNIWSFHITNNDQIFAGVSRILSEIDKIGTILKKYSICENGDDLIPANSVIFNSFRDDEGRHWIGSSNGLAWLNEDKCISKFKTNTQLDNSFIWYFQKLENSLLIGTSKGLYSIDLDSEKITIFSETQSYSINHFYIDESNNIWLATDGSGMIKIDSSGKILKSFTKQNGFSSNNLIAIYPDENGFLWIPSYYGLIRFQLSTEDVQIFWESDGLTHNEFNRASHFQDSEGRLYFGGLNGVTVFDPSNIDEYFNEDNPLRVISYEEFDNDTGLLVDKLSILNKNQKIELDSDGKSFRLEFSLLNFESSDKNSYAYQIEGLDKNWNFVDENYVRINQLPYGSYTLNIKGRNANSEWSTSTLSIPLKVKRPFYAKTFWRIIGVLLLFGFGYGFVKLRVFYLEKEKNKLEKIVTERTAIIENQKEDLLQLNATKDKLYAIIAHDLRDPVLAFRGIAGKINYLIKKKQDERVVELANYVEESAENLSNLLENLLGWTQQQRGELHYKPSSHGCKEIITEVFDSLQTYADSKRVKLSYEGVQNVKVFGDYQMLTTVFRNLVHNAIKYSSLENEVKVLSSNGGKSTHFEIQNKGIFIPKELSKKLFNSQFLRSEPGTVGEKGTGFGLSLCNDLVARHEGTIEVESFRNGLTSFKVSIPTEQ